MRQMADELIKACEIYAEICRCSRENQKGISIKELKKKFGLKKRDIIVLLQFLYDVVDFEYGIDFLKYTSNGEIDESFGGIEVETDEDMKEYASDQDIYISIQDSAPLFKNWLTEEDINLTNDTFYHNLGKGEISKVWNQISTVSGDNYTINKSVIGCASSYTNIKYELITAILGTNKIQMKYENRLITEYPLGLRYIKIADTYKVIMTDNNTIKKEYDLSKIQHVEIYQEQHNYKFNIYDYIDKKPIQHVILKVYPEGNVPKKIEKMFSEYKLICKNQKEEFIEYDYAVEDAGMLESMIKSFGRSVIVKEPYDLRNKIYQETMKIFEFYENCDKGIVR